MTTPSFNMYKIAHTSLGRSCILYFETVLGMNKITPIPSPPPKIKKVPKFFFNDIFKNLFKGVGFLINYNMVRGLPGRSCLKSFNIKRTSSLTNTLKKLIKFQKFIFSFVTIFKKKNSYLILRSGKFGNLVTSFFFFDNKIINITEHYRKIILKKVFCNENLIRKILILKL